MLPGGNRAGSPPPLVQEGTTVTRTDWIGLRVARWRDAAGMSQQTLADRVGYSREYISMIESGKRPVTKRATLIALASALGVSITDLTGQPSAPKSADDLAIYASVPALRGALDDDPDTSQPVDIATLAAAVDRAMAARMSCEYREVAGTLPGLVADTRRADAEGIPGGADLLVRALVTAALTIKPFGHIDLSARYAERAELVARRLGDPAAVGAARFAGAQTALASGTLGGRVRSLTSSIQAADELGDDGDAGALTWYGMLRLHGALSAASLGRHDDATALLAEAEAAAGRVTGDPWRVEFGRVNVAIWRVGVSVENGEPERAPYYARLVDRSQIRTANRRARLHIDAGRGCYAAGDQKGAVRQWLSADDAAPAELRSRPTVQELVAQIVRDSRRRGWPELHELAVRLGIDPLDPDADQT